jgi:hypothetical protein
VLQCGEWHAQSHEAGVLTFNRSSRDLEIMIISDDKDIITLTRWEPKWSIAEQCPGYQLTFPGSQQAHTSYPFALHSTHYVAWGYSSCKDRFFVTSHSCTGNVEVNGCCKACNSLGRDNCLQNIVARYTNCMHDNALLVFHGIGSLIEVVHWKTSMIDTLCLHRLNDVRKLVVQEGIINIHKQMLLALSTQCIPQIDCVLWVGFKHGTGIHLMLEMIKKAVEGMYHPKGFDEEEDLQALLFLCLGST